MTVAIDNFKTVFDNSITDADRYIQLLKEVSLQNRTDLNIFDGFTMKLSIFSLANAKIVSIFFLQSG